MIPSTVQDLTERVIRLTPRFLDNAYVDVVNAKEGYALCLNGGEDLYNRPHKLSLDIESNFEEDVLRRQPFMVRYENPLYTVWLDYGSEPKVCAGQPAKFKLYFKNAIRQPQWLEMCWRLPDGWQITPAPQTNIMLPQHNFGLIGTAQAEFTITPGTLNQSRYDVMVDIRSEGRHTRCIIPVTLLAAADGSIR